MNNSVISIGDIASALAGAGLTQINNDLKVAVVLLASSVALKILVAIFNKQGIPLSKHR